jgi:cytochrome c553
MLRIILAAKVALALALPAVAQDTAAPGAVTLEAVESQAFGRHLTAQGRAVYHFTADTPALEDQQATITCTTPQCLQDWALVTTDSEPVAGEGVDPSLIGTIDHDGQRVVTYAGWPLYHYLRDQDAQEPTGNDIEGVGGQWQLMMVATPVQQADLEAGGRMFARACAQCHGRAGRGMASFPSLRGRDEGYIASRLTQYRARETVGPNSALMWPVSAELSDQDIANLSAHVAGFN